MSSGYLGYEEFGVYIFDQGQRSKLNNETGHMDMLSFKLIIDTAVDGMVLFQTINPFVTVPDLHKFPLLLFFFSFLFFLVVLMIFLLVTLSHTLVR